MDKPALRMPSMKALQVLECVARTGSFKDAATELYVTPAAVSFQIRQLEKDLETQLFDRAATGVIPTKAGEAFIPKLTAGIATLHQAFQDFLDTTDETAGPMRVTSGPAVMSKWLVPQVSWLKSQNPNIEIEFSSELNLMDLDRDNIDFAIRFGSKPHDRYSVIEICEEYLVPVIAPKLRDQVVSPSDLAGFDLIHDKSLHLFDKAAPSWESWYEKTGLQYDAQRHGISFSQSDHAVQAARSGAGVALVRVILAGPELQCGQLVVPFGPAIPTGLRYYLLSQNPEPQTVEETQVKDWLLTSIAAMYRDLITTACNLDDGFVGKGNTENRFAQAELL